MDGGDQKVSMLMCIPPTFLKEGTIFYVHDLLATIQPALDKYVHQPIDMVSTMEEYEAIPEEKRYTYTMIAVQMGSIAPSILDD